MILTSKFINNAYYFKHQRSVQEDGKVLADIVTRSMKEEEEDHGKMHRFCVTKAMLT